MPKRETKCSTSREQSGADGVCLERNWSELPQDILHLLSRKLPDIFDYIRFRAVSKSWQFSAPITDHPPQLPWLVEHRQDIENAIIRFYCLLSNKIHTVTCPSFRRDWLIGPGYHYLLNYRLGSSEMYLLNPLTRAQIYVPWVNFFGCPDYIGPDQIEGGGIVVISGTTNYSDNTMAFWRPKDDNWNFVDGVGNSANAFYRGQYFSNDEETGITNVIDIATKKLAYQVAPPESFSPLLKGYTYIVESGGKILRLFHHDDAEPSHFDIHYLYLGDSEGKRCWVKITDIGDQMLFLQYNRGFSFCASSFVGFKGNCIYFMKYWQYLCRYDIGDGTTEVLPCPFHLVETWFVPSLV